MSTQASKISLRVLAFAAAVAAAVLVSIPALAVPVLYNGTMRVIVRAGTAPVYLGGSDVTTAGYLLSTADSPLHLNLLTGESLYGTSTGSIAVGVLRTGETT